MAMMNKLIFSTYWSCDTLVLAGEYCAFVGLSQELIEHNK